MPGRSGIDGALAQLQAASPPTRVLVLPMQDDPSYVRQAFAAGAHGYLVKEADVAPRCRRSTTSRRGTGTSIPSLGARLAALDAYAHEGAGQQRSALRREHEVL